MNASVRPERWRAPSIEAAARQVIDYGLGEGRSTLRPELPAWRQDVAQELRRRVVDSPMTEGGSFLERLARQLDGAPDGVRLLCAELLFLQCLPLGNVGAATKYARLEAVLRGLQDPVELPETWRVAIEDRGVFNGGVGFNVQIWNQLGWLLTFVSYWWSHGEGDRRRALADPWEFRRIVAGIPSDQPGIRNALLYMAFPKVFFPIVNAEHKRRIRDAFADVVGGATGKDAVSIDRDLHAIHARQTEQTGGGPVWYYDEPYVSQWTSTVDEEGQRAWLIRPREGGTARVDAWRAEGYVSLPATHLGDVPPGADLASVRAAAERGYQHLDYAQRLSLATEYHMFLSRMKADDLVLTLAEDRISVGVITGDAVYAPDQEPSRLRRAVAWSAGSRPLADVAAPVPALLDQQGTVVDITAGHAVISELVAADAAAPARARPSEPATGDLVLEPATKELAAQLYIDRAWLQSVIDLLAERRQVVLYGPPGTGKTFVGRAVARHVAEQDAVRLVQFHPSYSYEDFFEGFRPDVVDGQPTFRLTPGPLRQIAAEAASSPSRPYVLVIDEVNRANLAKVFGELYYLLEYRTDSIRLQYSPGEAFRLPPNLYLIATMNSADRSIASLDAAIRRRFAFVEMHPDEPPVRDVLPNFLAATGQTGDRATLMATLNAAIGEEDRDFRIGPSYFMRPHAGNADGLRRIWQHDLLPLLEDHYTGRLDRAAVHRRFGLEVLPGRPPAEPMPDPNGAAPDSGQNR